MAIFYTKCHLDSRVIRFRFVLAGLAEDSLRSALMLSRGDFMPFLTRPVSAAVLALSVLVLVLSLRRELTLHGAKP